MKLSILSLVIAIFAATAFGAITHDSPHLSPMLNVYGDSYMTDEGGRRLPMLGVALPDANGNLSLNPTYFVKDKYSQVTGLEDKPLYNLANGQSVPLVALVHINSSSRLAEPLGAALSGAVTLAGDVTGSAGANSVALVGGSSAASVHTAQLTVAAAASANTSSTLVIRDGSGNFSAGVVSATPKVPVQAPSSTPACAAGSAGSLALTSVYVLCVCNATSWVHTSDGSTACTF